MMETWTKISMELEKNGQMLDEYYHKDRLKSFTGLKCLKQETEKSEK